MKAEIKLDAIFLKFLNLALNMNWNQLHIYINYDISIFIILFDNRLHIKILNSIYIYETWKKIFRWSKKVHAEYQLSYSEHEFSWPLK